MHQFVVRALFSDVSVSEDDDEVCEERVSARSFSPAVCARLQGKMELGGRTPLEIR